MRQFGPRATPEQETVIREAAAALFAAAPERREYRGADFVMDDAQAVVMRGVELRLANGERLRINQSEPSARPPFEWVVEITSELGESDYLKHYLVRDDDIVLAQRKELTPIDQAEAEVILADLAEVQAAVADGRLYVPRRRRAQS